MARSVWKGPFVDLHLLKKAEAAQDGGELCPDQDLVASLHHPAVRRADLQRLQRPQVRAGVGPSRLPVGMKLGEFAPTRFFPCAADKKGKR